MTSVIASLIFGGDWQLKTFIDEISNSLHYTISKGDIRSDEGILVRMHVTNTFQDLLGIEPKRQNQISDSMNQISEEGRGVLVLLNFSNQTNSKEDKNSNTLRRYGIGAQILRECNIRKMRLLTNNPRKIIGLEEGYGLKITKREPIEIESNCVNDSYLRTKREKLGHFLSMDTDEE